MPAYETFHETASQADITIKECAGGYIVLAPRYIGTNEDEDGEYEVNEVNAHIFTDQETMFMFIGKTLNEIKDRHMDKQYPELKKIRKDK